MELCPDQEYRHKAWLIAHLQALYPGHPARYIFKMFDALINLFSSDEGEDSGSAARFTIDDMRLCEAALMFHVIAADGKVRDVERQRMSEVLADQYDLSGDELTTLFKAARKADSEAVDLYRFTSHLKRELDRSQRIAIIERLWEMVFADGTLHEFEDNVVWRVAQLLEVETPDRIAMKQRVRSRLGLDKDDQASQT